MTPNLPVGCAKVWPPRLQHEHNKAYMYSRLPNGPYKNNRLLYEVVHHQQHGSYIQLVGHSMTFTETGWNVKATHSLI